ncbi:MAG: sugar ABC transporter ATP-binding protein [Pseudomonadota bacterium]
MTSSREPAEAGSPLLLFDRVSKRFGGTLAVHDVTLDLEAGDILALLGENGAGKSTMIKMLAGIHPIDSGDILLNGTSYHHRPPVAGEPQDVAFIHQDLGLIEWMTVAENIALGRGFVRKRGFLDWSGIGNAAKDALALVELNIDPETRVSRLSRTEKSLVAIARALAVQARILVLDEPTASLPQDEVERLFHVLRRLKARNVGMIYVSHRLDEVFALADRVAVLRDGELVGVKPTVETSPNDLVEMIIGRKEAAGHWRDAVLHGTQRLSVSDLKTGGAGPLSFDVAAGEALALVGLRGAGQSDIGRAIFGVEDIVDGQIKLDGEPLDLSSPGAAMASGVSFVAGDRGEESLLPGREIRENLFANPGARGRSIVDLLAPSAERREASDLVHRFDIRPRATDRLIETLSGGNQQKVVMARWLAIGAPLLILEEPTAGVDVGAKGEIYALLAEARRDGVAVLIVSTDFEEVARIADRALVFSRGAVAAELAGDDLTPERLLHAASISQTEDRPSLGANKV